MSTDLETPVAPPAEKSSSKTWIIIGGVILVLLCLCCVVLAVLGYYLYSTGQLDFLGGGLNPDAAPRSGAINLQAGFLPDPYTATTTSGGTVDVSNPSPGIGCVGFATREPNFTLNWDGSSMGMSIFFVSDSGQDTALLVRSPQGDWYCNDDFAPGIFDPMVEIGSPAVGEYDIWVSNLMQGETGSGTVFVTELYFNPSDPYGYNNNNNNNNNTTGGSLEVGAPPNYGEADLSSGFSPDPFMTPVTSGGSVDVYSQNLDSGCTGYATNSPDFRLNWTGASDQLDIFFLSDGDTTLIINDPNGNWLCNDDSNYSYDPQVTINNPRQGQYDIWVGSYSQGNTFPGTLYVTEDAEANNPGTIEGTDNGNFDVNILDYTLPANYGTTDLAAGFSPDPFTISMTSGGSVDVFAMGLGPNCTGYATPSPDFSVYWTGNASKLRFYFVASDGSDTTLIINTSTAQWVCNDDAGYGPHPMIDVSNPTSGRFDIWVGTYSMGDYASGTLYVTTGNSHP